MVPSDGCGVSLVLGASRGRGAGCRAGRPHLGGVGGRILAACGYCPESANSLSTAAAEVACGGVLAPDWAVRLLQLVVAADWAGRGWTFGRGPPFCHRMGPWGAGSMMERLPWDNLGFYTVTQEGASAGWGS